MKILKSEITNVRTFFCATNSKRVPGVQAVCFPNCKEEGEVSGFDLCKILAAQCTDCEPRPTGNSESLLLSNDGQEGVVFCGIPDWVYEGEASVSPFSNFALQFV